MPKISIIIPTYNRISLINETLNSIIDQTFKDWECILIDDDSIDGTFEFIQDFVKSKNKLKAFKRPENLNKGANSCRNYGYSLSNGNYICWFDSDDIMKKNYLELLYSSMKDNADVVICNAELLGSVEKNYPIQSDNLIEDLFLGNVKIETPKCLWRKSFLEGKKLFDEEVMRLQDWEFNLRIFRQTDKIRFLENRLYYYRRHKDSITTSNLKIKPFQIACVIEKVILKNFDYLKSKNKLLKYLLGMYSKQLAIILELNQFKNAIKLNNIYLKLIYLKPYLLVNFFVTYFGILSFYIFKRGYFFFK